MQECTNDFSSVSCILPQCQWVKVHSSFSSRYPLRYREHLTAVVIVGWRKGELFQHKHILCKKKKKKVFPVHENMVENQCISYKIGEGAAHSGKYAVKHTENYSSEVVPVLMLSCC